MAGINIVFLDKATVDRSDLDFQYLNGLLESINASINYFDYTDSTQVNSRISQADIVITNKVVLNQSVLQQAEKLKLICVAATGTNVIDLVAAAKLNIAVCNVRAYASPSVVQHVFALLLALNSRLIEHVGVVERGLWQQQQCFCWLDYSFHELAGKKLGIVGFGELGKAVAAAAPAFALEVIVSNRPGIKTGSADANQRMAFETMLAEVDFLSLHCPLAENTKHLINENTLALMKPKAILINTARGGLVDEHALAQALIDNRIGGAGLDVLSQEPPNNNNPLLKVNKPNLIITPHIAWATIESRQRLLNQVADNILSFHKGALKNQVL